MKLIRKILFTVAFLTAAGVMVYSGFQIATVLRDRHASSSANEALQQQAVVQLVLPYPVKRKLLQLL